MTCKKDNIRQCKSSRKNFKSLEDIVAAYEKDRQEEAEKELQYYVELPSFEDVVKQAALAKGPWEGTHDHQNKYGVAARLPEFAESLLEALPELKKSASFDELYNAIEARRVYRVGKLTVYDTALRIGANLKIEPTNVYLHRGAKKGAEYLGITPRGRRFISVDELCDKLRFTAFRKLKPREIEDCLCIYKDAFKEEGVL